MLNSVFFVVLFSTKSNQTTHKLNTTNPSTLFHFEFKTILFFSFLFSLIVCFSKSNEANAKMCVLNCMQTQQQMRVFEKNDTNSNWHTQTQTQEILLFFSCRSRAQRKKTTKSIYSHIILVYVCADISMSLPYFKLSVRLLSVVFCGSLSLVRGMCV